MNNQKMNHHWIVVVLTLVPLVSPAAVKPHALFSDGAVLQCDQPVPVWGTADDGEKVTVTFAGQSASTTAKDGQWSVRLKPLTANAKPQTMTIAGANTVTITNLLVGEVWICSGQSNMQWPLEKTENSAAAIAAANDTGLRLFTVPRQGKATPHRDVAGSWSECNPKTVAQFSAVAYYFGRDLRAATKRPIGLISSNVGGTSAQRWTSREALASHPELRSLLEAQERAVANYPAALAKYKAEEADLLAKYAADAEKAKQAGQKPPRKPAPPKDPTVDGATTLYNGMIAPLVPFAMRGVIWYQGEANNSRPDEYRKLFPAMIRDWRTRWGQGDFPFLFVQIAPNNRMSPEIREAQLRSWQTTPNTAMAVITDCGDAQDIHPKRKEPVGQRLARAARALAYGEKIEYSGPVFSAMQVTGDQAVLSFTHVGGGLVAKDGDLQGFTIAGDGKDFVLATAKIEGDKVLVSASGIQRPVAVRYGWTNVPVVNLFNKDGLPATPFRTDAPQP
jgi:sialate O-acetylesterase